MAGFSITRRGFINSALSMASAAPTVLGAATQAYASEPIKLGFNGDLSASPSAQSGRAAIAGIRAAIEDIEKSGGILNRPVNLVVRDDLSQPPKSIQNMSDLIDNEKVVAVLGPTNSGNALAWKQMPNQKRIPVLGCIASATDITKPISENADNYMFRVGSVDRFQVVALIAYATKNPNAKRIGLLSETTGYGQSGLKDLLDVCKIQSILPAANEKFGVNDTDMTSQLTKMRDAGVDTVLLWAQGTPIGQIMRSMDKIGYFPLVLASWAADNLSFFNTAGPALAEKPVFLRPLSQTLSPRQQRFFDRIRAQLDADSAFTFAVQAYDATMLLAKAITQANTTNGSAIRSALENLADPYEGYSKTFRRPFSRDNHEGLAPSDQHWTCWRHGKLAAYRDAVISSLTAEDFKG